MNRFKSSTKLPSRKRERDLRHNEFHAVLLGVAGRDLRHISLSVPLSAALIGMLRRAYSLAPPLTATMAGLASAAAAATLLNFFHPFDTAVGDLGVHSVAVLIVVAAARAVGSRTLQNSFATL
jgi:hypothetical protein